MLELIAREEKPGGAFRRRIVREMKWRGDDWYHAWDTGFGSRVAWAYRKIYGQ